jgi:hypothetical protein
MTVKYSGDVRAPEDPIGNLMRIRSDTARQREGWYRAAATVSGWASGLPIGLVSMDIDSSAEIRRHGIEAKVELVTLTRDRVLDTTPPSALVVDSGTRDETWLVVPGLGLHQTLGLADELRSAVRSMEVWLNTLRREIRVTVSCGVGAGVAGDLAAVRESARAGLAKAKQSRDACAAGVSEQVRWIVRVPAELEAACLAAGIDISSAAVEYIDDVVMKYTGIWHWLITRGLETEGSGLERDTWRGQVSSALAERDPGFLNILDSVVLEWSLAQTRTSAAVPAVLADQADQAGGLHDVVLPASLAATATAKVIKPRQLTQSDVVRAALWIAVRNQNQRAQGTETGR